MNEASLGDLFIFAANGVAAQQAVDNACQYPRVPGSKKEGTSKLAATSIRSEVKCLREKVLLCLRNTDATADEVAAQLGESILSIRPRLSEALALGQIIETGERRKNRSGKLAQVWRAIC